MQTGRLRTNPVISFRVLKQREHRIATKQRHRRRRRLSRHSEQTAHCSSPPTPVPLDPRSPSGCVLSAAPDQRATGALLPSADTIVEENLHEALPGTATNPAPSLLITLRAPSQRSKTRLLPLRPSVRSVYDERAIASSHESTRQQKKQAHRPYRSDETVPAAAEALHPRCRSKDRRVPPPGNRHHRS